MNAPPAPRFRAGSSLLRWISRRCSPAGLWRHPDFLKLWVGQAVSVFGSQITPVALPLTAALTLDATAGQMGALRAAEYLPPVVVGLVAGVWVDRLRRRPILIGTEVLRALVLVAVPAAAAVGLLRLELLYTVALTLGALGAVFGTAYAAYLPSLVPRASLVEANGKLATTAAVAYVTGPGIAGVLVQLLSAPGAIVVDGLTFLASAWGMALIRTPEPAAPPRAGRRHVWAEIGEGLRTVARDPILRAFLASSAAFDVFWNGIMAVYVLYLTRDLGLPPAAVGLIFGLGGVGALAGAALAHGAGVRLGLGRTIVGAQLLLGAGGLLIALTVAMPAFALPLLVAAEIIQSGANTVYTVNRTSLEQAITPVHVQGRVRGSQVVIGAAAVTLGSLLGGLLGERTGLRHTIVLGVGGGLFAFLWVWWSPVRKLRGLPDAPTPAPPAAAP